MPIVAAVAKPSLRAALACATIALWVTGCYDVPPLGLVSGRVTLDGTPLDNATILFVPTEGGRPSTCITSLNGRYELRYDGIHPGAILGRHTVMISTFYPEITSFDESDDAIVLAPERPERIPSRYNTRTELAAEIRKGLNTFDFALTSDPPTDPAQ